MPNPPLIAFADDDPDQGHLLATWLTRRGCHVVPFSTGDALVDWVITTAPPVNAFLLDAEMPGRDGIECCRALRTLPAFATVPIVFVTGAASVTQAHAADAGAGSVIAKDGGMLRRLGAWLDEALGARP
ncbi:MAG TPA: response regulator [Longimicrobium sp.]